MESTGQQVVVWDNVSDTADVLRAVLEPRGVHVSRMRTPIVAPALEPASRPVVIVVDADTASPAGRLATDLSAVPRDVPQVIIGSVRVPTSTDDAPRRYLQKPFHYGELIQAVEALIADSTC